MKPLIIDGRKKHDKAELYEEGKRLAEAFLKKNGIKQPTFILLRDSWQKGDGYPKDRAFQKDRGRYYQVGRRVVVNLKNCRPVTKTPGFAWSYPGFKADATPAGVVCHETGHHVQFELGAMDIARGIAGWWGEEHSITGYHPNTGEDFAEAIRLFILNPDLLKAGRPMWFKFLRKEIGLKPVHATPWIQVMKFAHPKFKVAARSWIKRGIR